MSAFDNPPGVDVPRPFWNELIFRFYLNEVKKNPVPWRHHWWFMWQFNARRRRYFVYSALTLWAIAWLTRPKKVLV